MAVVTSTRIEAVVQKDGRLAVLELHQADGGEFEERRYIAPVSADLDALLAENRQLFLESLADRLGKVAVLTPIVLVGTGPPPAVASDDFYLDETTGNLYRRV